MVRDIPAQEAKRRRTQAMLPEPYAGGPSGNGTQYGGELCAGDAGPTAASASVSHTGGELCAGDSEPPAEAREDSVEAGT